MKDEQIKTIKNWPKLMSVKEIHIFIGFINFYQRFIQSFSRIAILLTLLLKTTRLLNLVFKAFIANDNKIIKVDNKTNKTIIN